MIYAVLKASTISPRSGDSLFPKRVLAVIGCSTEVICCPSQIVELLPCQNRSVQGSGGLDESCGFASFYFRSIICWSRNRQVLTSLRDFFSSIFRARYHHRVNGLEFRGTACRSCVRTSRVLMVRVNLRPFHWPEK